MNTQSFRPLFSLLALALVVMLVAIACITPTSVGVKGKALGLEIEVKVDSAGNSSTSATGSLPPGKCLRIKYLASDGSDLGSKVISVPGSCQIPAGAVHQVIDLVDCPPPAGTQTSASMGSTGIGAQHGSQLPEWHDVVGFPILPDTTSGGLFFNAAYHLRVLCLSGQDPRPAALQLVLAGPGSVVPNGVEVCSFAQLVPELGGALLRVADTDTFTRFSFDWNGVSGYADLATGANVTQYNAPNHWNVIESFIPLTDFNSGIGDWNIGTANTRTSTESADRTQHFEYHTLAF